MSEKTDRELLEPAAKAAELDLKWQGGAPHIGDWLGRKWWNPLTDDGDALRLAVACGISLDCAVNRCWAWRAGMAIRGVYEEFYGADPYAATRRAIVRAAAATYDTSIGKV